MKECRRCGKIKSRSEFYKRTASVDGLAYICKPCSIEQRREYTQSAQGKRLIRSNNLKRQYGITVAEYNEIFAEQEGRCKICKRHESEFTKRFAVDHNHETGKIRGLLCHQCNTALGFLREDPIALKAMLDYLAEDM